MTREHTCLGVLGALLIGLAFVGCAHVPASGDAGEDAAADAELATDAMPDAAIEDGRVDAPELGHWSWQILDWADGAIPVMRCGWDGPASPFPLADTEMVEAEMWLVVDGAQHGGVLTWQIDEACLTGASPGCVEWSPDALVGCTAAKLEIDTIRVDLVSGARDLREVVILPAACTR
jgi:hypothetical protein